MKSLRFFTRAIAIAAIVLVYRGAHPGVHAFAYDCGNPYWGTFQGSTCNACGCDSSSGTYQLCNPGLECGWDCQTWWFTGCD